MDSSGFCEEGPARWSILVVAVAPPPPLPCLPFLPLGVTPPCKVVANRPSSQARLSGGPQLSEQQAGIHKNEVYGLLWNHSV